MFCVCIKLRRKGKAAATEWSFHRSNAPSPSDHLNDGLDKILITGREAVMEPGIVSPVQEQRNIDEIILSTTTL